MCYHTFSEGQERDVVLLGGSGSGTVRRFQSRCVLRLPHLNAGLRLEDPLPSSLTWLLAVSQVDLTEEGRSEEHLRL